MSSSCYRRHPGQTAADEELHPCTTCGHGRDRNGEIPGEVFIEVIGCVEHALIRDHS